MNNTEIPLPPKVEAPASIYEKITYWRKKHKRALAIGSTGFGIFVAITLCLGGYAVWNATHQPFQPPEIIDLSNFNGDYATLGDGPNIPTPVQDPNHLPSVTLGKDGGLPELDRCDGTFIRMADYSRVVGLQDTYAAHNSCGGDVILPLGKGSRLLVNGIEYEVVSTRDLPKEGSKATQLLGLDGDIILQSCYYLPTMYMHFLGVTPVSELQQNSTSAPSAVAVDPNGKTQSPAPNPSLTPTN